MTFQKLRTVKNSKLKQLANKYKRPLSFFFLKKAPEEKELPDFRSIPKNIKLPLKPKTRLAIRLARRMQTKTFELSEELEREINVQIPKGNLRENPEEVAIRVRNDLNVKNETQFLWENRTTAIHEWRKLIENLGIIVSEIEMDKEDASGFAMYEEGKIPLIAYNNKDVTFRKIFSIFHEFAHLILKLSGICNMEDEKYLKKPEREIEVFCNNFAGEFLVPRIQLINENIVKRKTGERWFDDELDDLSEKYKVSREVILRRLLIIGKTSSSFYEKKVKQWYDEYIKSKEDNLRKLKEKDTKYIPPYYEQKFSQNGAPFVELVLDSYSDGIITICDVSDYLDIKIDNIQKLEDKLWEW